MTRKTKNDAVEGYWAAHYVSDSGLCSLCGNTGLIDTRGRAISAAGVHAGRVNFCICPNGQARRAEPSFGVATNAGTTAD